MFPYQRMFIIFDVFTALFGISLWWLVPDSPMSVGWLNERERVIAVECLKGNKTGVKNTHHKKAQVKEALRDPCVCSLLPQYDQQFPVKFHGAHHQRARIYHLSSCALKYPGWHHYGSYYAQRQFFSRDKIGRRKKDFRDHRLYVPDVMSSALLYSLPSNSSTIHARLGTIFIISILDASAVVMYSLLASNIVGYTKRRWQSPYSSQPTASPISSHHRPSSPGKNLDT